MKALCGLCLLVFLVANGFAQDEVVEATDLDALRGKVGTEATVQGLVHDIGTTKNASMTFINIGMPKKEGFVALVFEKDYAAFPDGFDKFRNQKVRVKGMVKLYKSEIPQIILTSGDQIEIVPP